MANRQISGLTADTPLTTDVIAQQDAAGSVEAKKSTIAQVLALETGNANIVTVGTVTTGNVDAVVSAASTTLAGKVELATDAEMTTGTATNLAITPANAKVELDKKATLSGQFNNQTGTTYTIVAGDNGKVLTFNNAASIAVTLPDTLDTNFQCSIVQIGAGVPTVTPATDTINGEGTGVTQSAQCKAMYLSQYAATTWLAVM